MAEANLKDLTNAVIRIAENSPIIRNDVKDIKEAVCGPAGILDAFDVLNKRMQKMEKNESLKSTLEKNKIKNINTNNKNLIKSTNSISIILNNILGKVDQISGQIDNQPSNNSFEKNIIKNTDTINKSVIKSSDSISKILNKILGKMDNITVNNNTSNSSFEKNILKNTDTINRNIIKSSNSISGILNKILGKMDSLSVDNNTSDNSFERGILKNMDIINRNIIKSSNSISGELNKILNKIDSKSVDNIEKKLDILIADSQNQRDIRDRLNLRRKLDSINNNLKRTISNQNSGSTSKKLDEIIKQLKSMVGRNNTNNISPRGARLTSENFTRQPERNRKLAELDSVSKSIDILERLKNISLRDFIFTKRKLKNISSITEQSRDMFKKFKNKEEADNTISFIMSSIDIVKKLGKVWLISKPAKLGAKALEQIYLGGKGDKTGKKVGGLVGLFNKISKDSPKIDNASKSISKISASCGAMLITSIVLTGIAVVGIPAMAGALLMRGIIWILTGAYKLLAKPKVEASVIKGSAVLLIMSASIITFGLGLGLMAKAVKDMKLKDVGIMVLSLTGLGLTVAGIGLLAAPIALGSATLILMGASLGIFALSIMAWAKMDSKKAIGNVKESIGGLRDALGIELGKHDGKKNMFQRIGGGIVDIAMSFINMGSTFFMMGTLLFAGFALGILYHGLKRWDRFDGRKAATNIKHGVGALKDALGIEGTKGETRGGLRKLGGSILDMGLSLFQGGKALMDVGVITIATAMADIIRVTLIPWEKYNAKPAAANLKIAIDSLKEVFGLENTQGNTKRWPGRLGGSLLDMGLTLLNGISELAKVGTITIATGMAALIRAELKPWEDFNPSASIGNMSLAINSLTNLFGLNGNNKDIFGKVGNLVGNLVDVGTTLLNSGGVLAKMGTITLATGMLTRIKENLVSWEDYNATKPIDNIRIAVDGLLKTFGLSAIERETEETATAIKKSKGFLATIADGIKAPFKIASSIADAAQNASENGQAMSKISKILHATSAMFSVKGSLEPWDEYDAGPAISNIRDAVSGIGNLFKNIVDIRNLEPRGLKLSNALYFETSAKQIGRGITSLAKSWSNSSVLKSAEVPFKKTVDIVNSIDMSKAKVLIELFGSFSKINKKPFDKFTIAVNKFAESSDELIDALNNFNNNYTMSETNGTGSNSGEPVLTKTEGININNTEALATALAEAMKSIPINVETSISDVRLVVNNEAGRRVILTLEN